MRFYMLLRLISISARMSGYPLLRAGLTLFLVVGFLYALHLAPHINYYYFTDPYLRAGFTVYYTPDIDARVLHNPRALEMVAKGMVECLNRNVDSYIVLGSVEVQASIPRLGTSLASLGIASSPEALPLIFPDIDVDSLAKHGESVDGVLVDVPDVMGYRLPGNLAGRVVPVSFQLRGEGNVTARLLVARSRAALERGRVIVLVGGEYLSLVPMLMPVSFAVGGGNTAGLEKCIDKVFKSVEEMYAGLWPPLRMGLYKVTRSQAYTSSLNNVYNAGMTRMLEAFSIIAVIVAVIVGFREGLAFADSSSGLIGVLRLYGAPRPLLFILGFSLGAIALLGALAGIAVIPYIYYHHFLGGVLAPPLSLLKNTWLFFATVLPACPLAAGAASLWYTSRRSLESLVAAG